MMRRGLARVLALVLILALMVPVSAVEAVKDCAADKVMLLVIPRSGQSLAELAAAAGAAVDDYALTEAGQAARATANRLLDRVYARAAEAAHCCAETARWTAALVGLAVEADDGIIPYLRAAGDLAPAGEQFDLYVAANYLALDVDSETSAIDLVEPQTLAEAEPVLPDLVVNVTEQTMAPAGDGTVIAILDTGFDADAWYFALPEGANPVLTGDRLAARLSLVGREPADEGQNEEKIPFLCNYAAPNDSAGQNAAHGTRVAALAGAYHGDVYDGAAPGAQLLLMKVFGDTWLAGEADILSAIDDALLLGADVINLSLGFPAGDGGEGAGLAVAVEAAQAVGVGVVAAAGNAGETGVGSFFYNRTGERCYPTENSDRGTLAAPASLPGVIAVGAATGSYSSTTVLFDEAGNRIRYTDTCDEYLGAGSTESDAGKNDDFAALVGGQAFSYVAVPGVGRAEDYTGLNVVGRVALVKRGEISFVEKTQYAADAGAIGVIVYDNDPETDGGVSMQLEGAALPAIFIGIADGQQLAEAGEGTLTFPDRDPSARGMQVRAIADFSSRGLREDFTFAPTLVALGENFVGLSTDDSLAILEGTSYAAAQVSGALVVLLGQLRMQANAQAKPLSDSAALAAAVTLLQNTAAPISTNGTPVSVRAQGAGLVDPTAAAAAPLLLEGSEGGAVTLTGVGSTFTLTFTIHNRTDSALDVVLTPSLWADEYLDPLAGEDAETMTEASERWLALCGYDREGENLCVTGRLVTLDAEFILDGTSIGSAGAVIELAPGESREIALMVKINPDVYAARLEAFPNGFTIEGRIFAEADGADLSLPFAAFCGDWAAAPLVSATAYDGGKQLYVGQAVTARLISGYEITLGEMQGGDVLQSSAQAVSELACFNPHGLAEPLMLNLCLLRNVDRYTVSVKNEVGEEVYTASGGGLRKAYCYNSAAVAERIPLWDGSVTDNPKYICPDGGYTITLTLYGAAGGEQMLVIPVRVDTTEPELVGAAFREVDGLLYLDLTFTDAEYVRAVYVADRHGYVEYDYSFFQTDSVLAAGRGVDRILSVDATSLYLKYIYLTIVDYAYNTTVLRLDREVLFAAYEMNG